MLFEPKEKQMQKIPRELYEDFEQGLEDYHDGLISANQLYKKLQKIQNLPPETNIKNIDKSDYIDSDNPKQIIPLMENAKQNNLFSHFLDLYMQKFCDETTLYYISTSSLYLQSSFVKPHEDTLLLAWKFMTKNCETEKNIFTKQDLQLFTEKYTQTLFARTTHKVLPFEPYYVNSKIIIGAQELIKPSYEYTPLEGMYHFDAKILCKMAIDLKLMGLQTNSINKAITELGFQKDPGQPRRECAKNQKLYYMPTRAQKELFFKYKDLTNQIISCSNLETIKKFQRKSNLKYSKLKLKFKLAKDRIRREFQSLDEIIEDVRNGKWER